MFLKQYTYVFYKNHSETSQAGWFLELCWFQPQMILNLFLLFCNFIPIIFSTPNLALQEKYFLLRKQENMIELVCIWKNPMLIEIPWISF